MPRLSGWMTRMSQRIAKQVQVMDAYMRVRVMGVPCWVEVFSLFIQDYSRKVPFLIASGRNLWHS